MSVLRRLDDFRGLSRFTTWAYKFALYEAAVKLRRRAWQEREVPMEQEAWDLVSSVALRPDRKPSRRSCWGRSSRRSTPSSRPISAASSIALAVNGVPIDVLAERLGTTSGALYKTLHDARRKLRRQLAGDGLLARLVNGGTADDATRTRTDSWNDCSARPEPRSAATPASTSSTGTSTSSSPGKDADAAVPGMRAHLAGCPACREEHESLRALVSAS